MKVVDKRNPAKVIFEELDVGTAYYDGYGNLCIKTSMSNDADNCLTYEKVHDSWRCDCEGLGQEVTPARVTIIIEG